MTHNCPQISETYHVSYVLFAGGFEYMCDNHSFSGDNQNAICLYLHEESSTASQVRGVERGQSLSILFPSV